jgi:DNA topoisomerase-3
VGRVQTPTLSIVVEREEKIRKHVSRDYWEVKADFDASPAPTKGKWFDPKFKKTPTTPTQRADRLWDEAGPTPSASRGAWASRPR